MLHYFIELLETMLMDLPPPMAPVIPMDSNLACQLWA